MTSSTWSPATPVLASKLRITVAPKSAADMLLNAPPNFPTAVLFAATITTLSIIFPLDFLNWFFTKSYSLGYSQIYNIALFNSLVFYVLYKI